MLQQHAMAIDVSDDGWTDVLGFYPNGSMFCTGFNKEGKYNLLVNGCKHEFVAFPEKLNIYPGMPHLFVDLNCEFKFLYFLNWNLTISRFSRPDC